VVEDSTVTYALVIDRGEQYAQLRYPNRSRLTRQVTREDLSINRSLPSEITWWVVAYDGVDSLISANEFHLWVAPLAVDEDDYLLPTEMTLGPIYPNPFNDQVNIRFALPIPGNVKLTLHDLNGRLVTVLEDGYFHAGRYVAFWNSTDSHGMKAASGVYICRMVTADGVRYDRLILMR